ncbi:MAG: 16S rRNA (cytosine(1402)-N(4))-methyltransferase RsmH [Acetobacter sp.]|nr:16S rRNA (cytosine(1402)-N(4))-methyltransferase RsmH [Bacteroides sp.]MCM1341589.1 16S rRNA (cytosine(1402)-N(4))-methyltransferase RsmH [Acetobacter sp.]MCM1433666.1 16S rRNA (cytosine(1402)-N(4))-methyltransferase RsmH [Clostridiales bacterium]
MEFVHKSVLFDEAVNALNLSENKIIVDGTAGGGGHSKEIAKSCKRLVSVDQDPDAICVLKERLGSYDNVSIVHNNFSDIKNILNELEIDGIDGILLDLGVSSFQLDTAERGFSFHKDAPLDMRMSKSGLSAKDVVNTYSQQELAEIIYRYGEERFSRRIAENIVKARQDKPIETTFELVDIIKSSMPQKAMRDSHPARRTFQAIRIEVNAELEVLGKTLDDAFDVLNSGGRIAVITFHSLEDRLVKDKFNQWSKGCTCPKEFPVCVCGNKPKGKVYKAVAPSKEELDENPRARSSRLRIFEKI